MEHFELQVGITTKPYVPSCLKRMLLPWHTQLNACALAYFELNGFGRWQRNSSKIDAVFLLECWEKKLHDLPFLLELLLAIVVVKYPGMEISFWFLMKIKTVVVVGDLPAKYQSQSGPKIFKKTQYNLDSISKYLVNSEYLLAFSQRRY